MVEMPPKNTKNKICRYGAKCRRKKCKYEHPPPEVGAQNGGTAVVHDSPKAVETTPQEKVDTSQNGGSKTLKKKGEKICKFGASCYRKNCPYLHPATAHDDEQASPPLAKEESTQEQKKPSPKCRKGKCQSDSTSQGGETSETMETEVTVAKHNDATISPSSYAAKKSKKKCFRGNKCRKPNCPYRHPQSFVPPMVQQQDETPPTMLDVATLEAEMVQEQPAKIPLAADLEETLVAPPAAPPQASPPKPSKRRGKRDKQAEARRRRRQEEQDRLIQQEEERLELEEVNDLFQQLEEEKRRLSADKARVEIDRIRQAKFAEKQEAKHTAVVQVNEEFADPERIRAERQALERFKQIQEDQIKSEEAARRLEEEERGRFGHQDDLIEREHQAEAERRRLAQEKVNELCHSQDLAKEEALHHEQAEKTQEEALHSEETDEERALYKAERKAAKKERRRLEREGKVQTGPAVKESVSQGTPAVKENCSISLSPSPAGSTGSNQENVHDDNVPAPAEEDEEAKKLRWQEELRRQKERAAEKKEEKQKHRCERMQQDFECQTQERTQFWQAEITDEKKVVEMILQLCAAEFCRKNPDVDCQTLLADTEARAKLEEAAQETYRSIFKAEIHSRVVVKGTKQKDLNDRNGTIQSWDEDKGKFYIGLDTKKGKNTQYLYLPPGNLEALPLSSSRKGKKKGDAVHMVFITTLFANTELMFDVYKNEVEGMKEATCLEDYLQILMEERDREEREAKELEEEELCREKEARRRRAEQRHRENMEWEHRQREYAEQKAEFREWRRQEREAKREAAEARARGERESFYEREHSQRCHCPRCEFENMFFGGFSMGGGRGGSPGIFFSFGGMGGGPGIFFSFEDEDFDEEDQWDCQWERMHKKELEQKNEEAAETLGVEVDATEGEIKRVFRRKARKYHPDSYRADNHEDGMTKEEAEEHFKELSNAYDHLMSYFDEDSDEEYESA